MRKDSNFYVSVYFIILQSYFKAIFIQRTVIVLFDILGGSFCVLLPIFTPTRSRIPKNGASLK